MARTIQTARPTKKPLKQDTSSDESSSNSEESDYEETLKKKIESKKKNLKQDESSDNEDYNRKKIELKRKIEEKTNLKSSQLSSYFGERNGINPIPKLRVDKNYTNETLVKSSPYKRANNILNYFTSFNNRSDSESFKPMLIYDIVGNIGLSAIAFISNPDVQNTVITYDESEDNRERIRNNVKLYDSPALRISDRIIIQDTPILGNPIIFGASLHFYPDWSDPNGDEDNPYKDENITIKGVDENKKIIKKSVEEWISFYTSVAFSFIFEAPVDYKFDGHEYNEEDEGKKFTWRGWEYKFEIIKSIYEENGKRKEKKRAKIFKGRVIDAKNPRYIESDYGLKELKVNDTILWEDACRGLKIRNPEFGSEEWFDALNDSKWVRDYQKYLEQFLKLFINNDEHIQKMLSKDNMENNWIRAVTHKTINLKYNYEQMEKTGDETLKLVFPSYIRNRFPDISEHVMTTWNNFYMSKHNQHNLCKTMKLDYWIICTYINPDNDKIREDIFESFFAALKYSADSFIHGLGIIYCENLIRMMFKDLNMDHKVPIENAKSELIQRGSALGLDVNSGDGGLVEYSVEKGINNIETSVYMTLDAINKLKNWEKYINHTYFNQIHALIAIGHGKNKKESSRNAWEKARESLINDGYTTKFENKRKLETFIDKNKSIDINHLMNKLNALKLESCKITDIKDLSPGEHVSIFVGFNEHNEEIELAIANGISENDAHKNVINKFLYKKK